VRAEGPRERSTIVKKKWYNHEVDFGGPRRLSGVRRVHRDPDWLLGLGAKLARAPSLTIWLNVFLVGKFNLIAQKVLLCVVFTVFTLSTTDK